MKIKSILNLAAIAFVGGIILTSCNSPAEKVENAEVALIQAEDKLDEAYTAYHTDLENHRVQTSIAIEENKKMIAAYNASILKEKRDIQASNKAKIDALETENTLLEVKMEAYEGDDQSNWENFRTGFNKEMTDLAAKIKDLTTKNPK